MNEFGVRRLAVALTKDLYTYSRGTEGRGLRRLDAALTKDPLIIYDATNPQPRIASVARKRNKASFARDPGKFSVSSVGYSFFRRFVRRSGECVILLTAFASLPPFILPLISFAGACQFLV
ncbi:MAG: hypothetical protein IKX40_10450 [Thermoguttaceae bacterium]|nr:hypothetical protein [Thermoguttaceae bacterium]